MANTIVTLSGDDAELYKAFQRIIDSQRKVDEGYDKIRAASRRAAKEAEAAAKEEARELERRRQTLNSLGESVVGMATAYFGVQAAIGKVNEGLQLQADRAREALDLQRQLAAAQQEAAKNLAGKTPAAISTTLQKTVPEIARRAGFSDLPALTTALGAAASIVGEDQARGVVEQSARLTRFTPGELQTTATATADLLAATGLQDARQGLALLASTGSVARPEQLAKLATGAAVAANAAIGGAPQQDRIAAAREGVALYAKLTKVDPQGQSAATATGQLIAQVGGLFTDTKAARERDDKIERLVEALESNRVATAQAAERLDKARAKDDSVGVLDATQDMNVLAGSRKRDAAELENLQSIQSAVAVDPGTFAGRLEKIRTTPALSQQLNETLTGEQKFLPLFRQLITAQTPQTEDGSNAKQVEAQRQTALQQWNKERRKLNELAAAGAPESEIIAQGGIADAAESRFNEAKAKFEESRGDKAGQAPQQSQIVAAQDGAGRSGLFGEFQTALKTITTDVKAFEQVADSVLTTPQSQIVAAENRATVSRNIAKARDVGLSARESMIGIAMGALDDTSTDVQTTIGTLGQRMIVPQVRAFNRDPTAFPNEVLLERLEYLRDTNAPQDQVQVIVDALASIQTLARMPELLEALQRNGIDQTKFLAEQTAIAQRTERLLGNAQGNGAPPAAAIRAQSQMPSVTGPDWGGSGMGQTGGSW